MLVPIPPNAWIVILSKLASCGSENKRKYPIKMRITPRGSITLREAYASLSFKD